MNKTKTPAQKPRSKTVKNKKSPQQKSLKKKERDSLVPLLIVLIILLIITSFLAFSDKSSVLSGIFSKDTTDAPSIERPEIVQKEVVKPEIPAEDSFSVSSEVEIDLDEEEPVEEKTTETPDKSIKSRLFFVKVSDEGQISLKSIIRSVNYQSAPLTETIKSLIYGPDRSDLNKGLLNLIPQKTELLTIKIARGTAFLDFNENFRYNSLGFEGYRAQLMQIVYTATEFESVDNVQILIEGEILDYLGAEGVYIGAPLNRENFNTF